MIDHLVKMIMQGTRTVEQLDQMLRLSFYQVDSNCSAWFLCKFQFDTNVPSGGGVHPIALGHLQSTVIVCDFFR
jgi:hypothetical protein